MCPALFSKAALSLGKGTKLNGVQFLKSRRTECYSRKKTVSCSLSPNKRCNDKVPYLLKTDRREFDFCKLCKTDCLKTRPHQTNSRDQTSGSSFSEHPLVSGEASVLQALKPNHSLHTGELNMKTGTLTVLPKYFTFCLSWTVETLETVTSTTAFVSCFQAYPDESKDYFVFLFVLPTKFLWEVTFPAISTNYNINKSERQIPTVGHTIKTTSSRWQITESQDGLGWKWP